MDRLPVVIIGAGPAGLTAARELVKFNRRPIVLEKRDVVGGLACTRNYRGYYFDIGGHRFFTKVPEVRRMWHDLLGDDFLRRPRLSRIYYNGTFFDYPLRPLNALGGLGVFQSLLVAGSYLRWRLFPHKREDTFEQWVTNRFGKRLYLSFFKTYTEKVWGIPCSELKAEWAAQRIKNLSLRTALLSMFLNPGTTIKTLIQEFEYPRLGPGMMWGAVRDEVERRGGAVRLNCETVGICRTGDRLESVVVRSDGREEVIRGTDFISSMPVTEFLRKLDPPPPEKVLEAVGKLRYRDFLTVCLVVNRPELFPDNWIYIHTPEVSVGRIQNYKNWSPDMVPDPAKTSLGLEYFCSEGDDLWNTPDAGLIELARREVEYLGLAQYADIEDGCVVRVPKAYPVYDSGYRECLGIVRDFVDRLENFQTIGRNGLHRYNNQDHAMLTGILAVRNLVLGQHNDLWSVNTDMEYLEELDPDRGVRAREVEQAVEGTLIRLFAKLDRVAFGLSLGAAFGILLFFATLVLVLKGGETVGPHLQLLSQYFPGYRVSMPGSVIGLAYGFMVGFITGWGFAFLRNATMFFYMAVVHRRAELRFIRRLLEFL